MASNIFDIAGSGIKTLQSTFNQVASTTSDSQKSGQSAFASELNNAMSAQNPTKSYENGLGGSQPVGSKYWGDNPMPSSYVTELSNLDASTANAIKQAKSLVSESNARNGYDDASSNLMQSLQSGGGLAVQTAASLLGVNMTADYGHLGIRGFASSDTSSGLAPAADSAKSLSAPASNTTAHAASAPVSDADVKTWLANHKNATDRQIAAAMDQYGVMSEQVARTTGMSVTEIQSRYDGANNPIIAKS